MIIPDPHQPLYILCLQVSQDLWFMQMVVAIGTVQEMHKLELVCIGEIKALSELIIASCVEF